jgi:hypothetical protein
MLERVSPAFTRYVPALTVAETALVLVLVTVAVGISARGEVAAGLGATIVGSGLTGVGGGGLLAQAAVKSSSTSPSTYLMVTWSSLREYL